MISRAGVARALAAAGALVLAAPLAPPASAVGGPLLTETFRNATVEPGFIGYGSACITGAAPAVPGPGEHALAGCRATATGPTPPTGADGNGFLQLTDAANDQSGAALFDRAIPADQGLVVTFEQWQYGSTTPGPPERPADGIAFFLTNGDAELDAPGAFGGSLGYAQKLPDDDPANAFIPGVNSGYLGIGLDYLGNYFGDWEQRGDGCPPSGQSPAGDAFRIPEANKITVRGPGNGTEGYCFLTSTSTNLGSTTGPWNSTLPLSLRSNLTTVPTDPVAADDALQPERRTVRVEITPAPNPVVNVSIAVAGNPLQQVLSFPAPRPVPDSYKFGFSASTGQFTDVHLIRNVVIESEDPTPALTLTKAVTTPGPYDVGDRVTYRYTVTNTGLADVADLAVFDDRISSVTCAATTLTSRDQPATATTTCTGEYVITAADAAAGTVHNVAHAEAEGGGVVSNEDDVTLPVRPVPTPTPTVAPTPTPTALPTHSAAPPHSVVASPSSSGVGSGASGLAGTGGPPRWLIVLGAAAVALGAVLARISRRKHRRAH